MVKKTQPYELLVNHVKANPVKGQTIPHADIENIMGIPYRVSGCNHANTRYSYHIQKANKVLTELHLRLEPIKGFGYRIIEDNQYVDSVRKAYNTGIKSFEKARFIADNTDGTHLSFDEYQEFKNVRDKVNTALKYARPINP